MSDSEKLGDIDATKTTLGLDTPVLDDNLASNNWVIHGSLTETGQPILANDPHLQTSLPCTWIQQELVVGDKYVSGVHMIGIPGLGLGRTQNFSWGITTPIADTSDLW